MAKKNFKDFENSKEETTNDTKYNTDANGTKKNRGQSGKGKRDTRNRSNNPGNTASLSARIDRIEFEAITSPLGRAFNLSRNHLVSNNLYSVPGIVRFTFTPTIGASYGSTSPFNVKNQHLQTILRSLGKYNRSYDPADIGMYALALTSYSTFYTWVSNIYRATHLVTAANEYYPNAYLRALLADKKMRSPQQLRELSYLINDIMSFELNAMFLPKDFTPIMYYKDYQEGILFEKPELGVRSQAYVFMPSGFYRYTPRDKTNPGSVTFYSMEDICKTVLGKSKFEYFTAEDLTKINEFLHQALFSDGDINMVSQDIRESLSGAESMVFDMVSNTDLPVFKEITDSFKISLRNADIVGNIESKSLKVKQVINLDYSTDDNYVKFAPKISKGGSGGDNHTAANAIMTDFSKALFFNGDEYSNEDQFAACRFKCLVADVSETDDKFYDKDLHGSKGGCYIINAGPEIINRVDIYWGQYDEASQRVSDWNEIVIANSLITLVDTFNEDSIAEILAGLMSLYPFPVLWLPRDMTESFSVLKANHDAHKENKIIPLGTIDQISVLPDVILGSAQRTRTQGVWTFGV